MTGHGTVVHEAKVPSTPVSIAGRTGPSSALPVGPVRNGPDGANALSRLEPAWITRRLGREPAGLSGEAPGPCSVSPVILTGVVKTASDRDNPVRRWSIHLNAL